MTQPFSEKLDFVLKALSVGRGRLAADLGVDKSAVGRWVTGSVAPSAHSLTRLTAFVAARVEGFTALDWESDLEALADRLGVRPAAGAGARMARLVEKLPGDVLDEVLETTARRGAAYEGFFRSTRPYAQSPGRFLHDQILIRQDPAGVLVFRMGTGGVLTDGWVLPLQNQLFVIAAERTSGALAFAIFHGVNTLQAGAVDGIVLNCALDVGRTPTASLMLLERVGELSGDAAADEARFAAAAAVQPDAPEGSIPEAVRARLAGDFGPAALAAGGDWLLRLPIGRSMARGLR